jgi:hypothetical protein
MAVLIQNLNRALFCLILTPGNKISFLGSYQKALTRCCNDPLRPPGISDCRPSFPIEFRRPFHLFRQYRPALMARWVLGRSGDWGCSVRLADLGCSARLVDSDCWDRSADSLAALYDHWDF